MHGVVKDICIGSKLTYKAHMWGFGPEVSALPERLVQNEESTLETAPVSVHDSVAQAETGAVLETDQVSNVDGLASEVDEIEFEVGELEISPLDIMREKDAMLRKEAAEKAKDVLHAKAKQIVEGNAAAEKAAGEKVAAEKAAGVLKERADKAASEKRSSEVMDVLAKLQVDVNTPVVAEAMLNEVAAATIAEEKAAAEKVAAVKAAAEKAAAALKERATAAAENELAKVDSPESIERATLMGAEINSRREADAAIEAMIVALREGEKILEPHLAAFVTAEAEADVDAAFEAIEAVLIEGESHINKLDTLVNLQYGILMILRTSATIRATFGEGPIKMSFERPDGHNSCMVNVVKAGGQAAKFGIVTGDRFKEVNGIDVSGLHTSELADLLEERPVDVVLEREARCAVSEKVEEMEMKKLDSPESKEKTATMAAEISARRRYAIEGDKR